jgi:hypothetical protein
MEEFEIEAWEILLFWGYNHYHHDNLIKTEACIMFWGSNGWNGERCEIGE